MRLEPELNDTKQLKRLEANKVFSALLNCAGLYISRCPPPVVPIRTNRHLCVHAFS